MLQKRAGHETFLMFKGFGGKKPAACSQQRKKIKWRDYYEFSHLTRLVPKKIYLFIQFILFYKLILLLLSVINIIHNFFKTGNGRKKRKQPMVKLSTILFFHFLLIDITGLLLFLSHFTRNIKSS